MVLAHGNGLPLTIDIEAANHAEVNLIEPLINSAVTSYIPDKLIDDRTADSNLPIAIWNSSVRIAEAVFVRPPRTDESSAPIAGGGKSNARSVGCTPADDW